MRSKVQREFTLRLVTSASNNLWMGRYPLAFIWLLASTAHSSMRWDARATFSLPIKFFAKFPWSKVYFLKRSFSWFKFRFTGEQIDELKIIFTNNSETQFRSNFETKMLSVCSTSGILSASVICLANILCVHIELVKWISTQSSLQMIV